MPFTRITQRQALAEALVDNQPYGPIPVRRLQHERDWWAFMQRCLATSPHRVQLAECYRQARHSLNMGKLVLHAMENGFELAPPHELMTDVAARHATLRFIRSLIEDYGNPHISAIDRTEAVFVHIRQIDCRTVAKFGAATITLSPNILISPLFSGRRPSTERPKAWFYHPQSEVYALGRLAVTQKINIPVYHFGPEPGRITEETGMSPDTLLVQPYNSRNYLDGPSEISS